jgi:hypothetical protein
VHFYQVDSISYLKVRGVICIFISLMRIVFCYQAESVSLRCYGGCDSISYLKVRGVIWIFISLMRIVFCYQAESVSLRLDNKTPFSPN